MDCENCAYYVYDADEDAYFCAAAMDEDEAARLFGGRADCPYFRPEDEYGIVRKQN